MEPDSFAPVLIPTLNRYEHFKRCIISLAACTYASKTVLYIALDYPRREDQWEGYNKIDTLISTLKGFKEVRVIRREKNYGAEKNLDDAKQIVYQDFDSYILSEDDNEFSPNFLDYMNKCLIRYKDNPNIYSVCGYSFPVDFSLYDKNILFSNLYSAWGAGMWREKEFPWDINSVISILSSPLKLLRVFNRKPKFVPYLFRMNSKHTVYGDLLVCAYSVSMKKLNVFPVVSKVKNHGHDGTGLHSTTSLSSLYEKQLIDKDLEFNPDDIKISLCKYKPLEQFFKVNLIKKIKIFFKIVLYWVRHR